MPEVLVIDWIDGHVRIVTPAIRCPGLRAGPVNDRGFTERHLAHRIACMSAGVVHAGKHGWVGAVRGAKTQGNISE